jgi:hypothetical protein
MPMVIGDLQAITSGKFVAQSNEINEICEIVFFMN